MTKKLLSLIMTLIISLCPLAIASPSLAVNQTEPVEIYPYSFASDIFGAADGQTWTFDYIGKKIEIKDGIDFTHIYLNKNKVYTNKYYYLAKDEYTINKKTIPTNKVGVYKNYLTVKLTKKGNQKYVLVDKNGKRAEKVNITIAVSPACPKLKSFTAVSKKNQTVYTCKFDKKKAPNGKLHGAKKVDYYISFEGSDKIWDMKKGKVSVSKGVVTFKISNSKIQKYKKEGATKVWIYLNGYGNKLYSVEQELKGIKL